MKIAILMGSPRKNGNTAALLRPFTEELRAAGRGFVRGEHPKILQALLRSLP